jgi:hypothetical protein
MHVNPPPVWVGLFVTGTLNEVTLPQWLSASAWPEGGDFWARSERPVDEGGYETAG